MLIEFAVTQISLETSIYGLLDKNGAMFFSSVFLLLLSAQSTA